MPALTCRQNIFPYVPSLFLLASFSARLVFISTEGLRDGINARSETAFQQTRQIPSVIAERTSRIYSDESTLDVGLDASRT